MLLYHLNTIECLKGTGMSLKEIKQYVIWCVEGFSSVPKRYEMMQQRKQDVENQIKVLNKILETIENKCGFYLKAMEPEIQICALRNVMHELKKY
jgi:DNA-binding transcriptional MerR regulator